MKNFNYKHRPPYSIEELRKADVDIWFKGKTGDYRKTFITRAAFILWGVLCLVAGLMFLYLLWLPQTLPDPTAKMLLRIIFWPLGLLFGPCLLLWGFHFIRNAVKGK